MNIFTSEDGQYAVLNLAHGERLLENLQQAAEELNFGTAAIVTGFGALSRLHIHYGKHTGRPPESVFTVYEEPLELCALSGVIADNQVHAHILASNGRQSFGGHLEPETVVCWLAEMVIQRLPLSLTREKDEYGIPMLKEKS
ncbi:MAG: DNA-binding protein [candidate division WS1 bacterium]|nr:DNA-binding protein [candidate division WS1 bacterium]